jgi:hypothetical protein
MWTVKRLCVDLMCQWIKTMALDPSRRDRKFKKCYICDEIDGTIRKKLGMLAVNMGV